MKNILVLADGKIAKKFIERVKDIDLSKKRFFIVYYDDNMQIDDLGESFLLYRFDPSSKIKLQSLLNSHEFDQAIIILSNKMDLMASYENIRDFDKTLPIVIHDRWSLELEDDKNLSIVDSNSIIANMLIHYLPDIPLYATNIGLEKGEIVEIKIPYGSPFTYRYISNIEQKRWKIAAIYRNNRLILPDYKTTLEPNDSILAVGNPNVLKSVYKSINREFGQFPIPFGENIYCFIDMAEFSDEIIEKLANDSILLHSHINSNKLIFRVINPRYSKILDKIKSYDKGSMQVELDFYSHKKEDIIDSDVNLFQVGLIVLDDDFFAQNIDLLYELKRPVLKVGECGFYKINEAVIISNESQKVEQISSTIFDLSSQLKLNISIYEFSDDEGESKKLIEHFMNLSKLFDEKVKVVKSNKNPILELKQSSDKLQFLPFDRDVKKRSFLSYFSKNANKLYFKLSKNYQIFLPSD